MSPAFRRPRPVEPALLGEQDERPIRRPTARDAPFRARDLLERSAQVDGAGIGELSRTPRDRAVDGEIELEDARPVAESLEAAAVAVRQPVASDPGELTPASMSNTATRWSGRSSSPIDSPARDDATAERLELRHESRRDPARATLRERPAVRMRRRQHDEPGGGADRLGQAA